MDPRLLNFYNQELQFVRESGAEFAKQYPKIAGRIGLDEFDCADPYVERLFEGFAFLAARVQLKMNAEFPRFTEHLLETVFPNYLAPTPSMAVVQMHPDLNEGALADGFTLPRHSVLQGLLGKGEQTRCTYRTAHDVELWPLVLQQADYFPRDVAALQLPDHPDVKAALVLRFQTSAGAKFNQLSLDQLPLFLQGTSDIPSRLYEELLANAIGIAVRPYSTGGEQNTNWNLRIDKKCVTPQGFATDQALLPNEARSFEGYRLLQEYFAFPERFMFTQLNGLNQQLRTCETETIEVAILLRHGDSLLANRVNESHFALFATPVINLFEKRADRILLSDRFHEYQVIPDRTRPLDFEVYSIQDVAGYSTGNENERPFLPFYAMNDSVHKAEDQGYYTLLRRPRVVSDRNRASGPRSSYIGSETFMMLVDGQEHALSHDLRQVGLQTLCTNRDLPLQLPLGLGNTDFNLEVSAPIDQIRCIAGPSKPSPPRTFEGGETVWRLISHLSLNYLSLTDSKQGGAAAMRELLSLYVDRNDHQAMKQVDALRSVMSEPVIRPIQSSGPMNFGRGLQITVSLDESGFEGTGSFLMASVLNEFFTKYVSINSFIETVLQTTERGEVAKWPTRMGQRHAL
ncbi:hypothetical protein SV7mr_40230 [Stieleria bergensis]|uniref:Type VI secretion protein, VC_A0110 family n=1 Tax=Stieleria bergensis TaxID=2528025 RepID=A0A517SZA8_9BACT|nr:hypothetical protein SV7mr_40230 [Planctomycetes bacterium SV_7m_r]